MSVTGEFCLEVANMTWSLFFHRWEGYFEKEDAIQEMALYIWKQRDSWKEGAGCSPSSWFSIAARRHILGLIIKMRRLKRGPEGSMYSLDAEVGESGDTWGSLLPSLDSDPVGPIEVGIIVEGVRKAVGELPEHQRIAMDEMLDHLSLFDSAMRHGVTRQAISARRQAGMKNLANKPWLGRLVSG